jgi:hypothetical protein
VNFDKRRGKERLPETTVRHTVLEAASTDDVMAKGLTGQSSLLHYQLVMGKFGSELWSEPELN